MALLIFLFNLQSNINCGSAKCGICFDSQRAEEGE